MSPRGGAAPATDMFADESDWRDLVASTRNIKTAAGPAQIQALLEATMPGARPSIRQPQRATCVAGGVTEGWLSFETAPAASATSCAGPA
jgi:putative flavoprotein involved in K+ transport